MPPTGCTRRKHVRTLMTNEIHLEAHPLVADVTPFSAFFSAFLPLSVPMMLLVKPIVLICRNKSHKPAINLPSQHTRASSEAYLIANNGQGPATGRHSSSAILVVLYLLLLFFVFLLLSLSVLLLLMLV